MKDLNSRIKQLTNLILTSQTVGENGGDESRPASPSKVDFDMTPYQVRSFFSSPSSSESFELTLLQTSSSNKNFFPRDARSNLKGRKSSRSKRRSSHGPSYPQTRRRTRRTACSRTRHATSVSWRWSLRGTKTTSAHHCVPYARTSNANGLDGSPRRKRSGRRRMSGQRSLPARWRRRKRSAQLPVCFDWGN